MPVMTSPACCCASSSPEFEEPAVSTPSGYTIHPSFARQPSKHDGMVYLAIYTIEDDKGVYGEPVVVSGVFADAEDAIAAAKQAGDKVLAQLH